MVSPANGVLTARNAAPSQKFERGTELFRIVDLSHVWVVAEVFEKEARLIKGITGATVRYQGDRIPARLSDTLSQFDPQTGVMKVRFDVDNLGLLLRPDMFVDVELQVMTPASITIPVDAALDSGNHKTVFVDRGAGYFEPRRIETGPQYGDRVTVTSGLAAGERVVVSGNFLLDSESRLKLAAEPRGGRDPVCGMEVDPAKKGTHQLTLSGRTHYFCSDSCKKQFQAAQGSKGGQG